jgi:hypothetical protein
MSNRVEFAAACVAVMLVAPCAHADFYQFSGMLDNGYSVQGILETMPSAPVSFIESNPNFPNAPFVTQYLQGASLVVSRFGAPIAAGLPIVSGVSHDPYLYVGFSSVTPSISALDLNTRGTDTSLAPYYFISNGVLPNYTSVPYGTTAYNLFLFDPSTSTATFLASTGVISVVAIPAPAGLLAFAAIPLMRRRRRGSSPERCAR